MKWHSFLMSIIALLHCTQLQAQKASQNTLVKYVNPFIGTGGHGHTYPGATVPFGMLQLSPDNATEGWDWSSGYHYSDSIIAGFSHTHLSGTGIGDLCDISVMPAVNVLPDTVPLLSKFSHKNETASPGFYSVLLDDINVTASFTATTRCGFHQYSFPASNNAMLRFDLGFKKNWDWNIESHFKQVDDSTFIGYRYSGGWANYQRVYFAARLSKPVKTLTIFHNKKQVGESQATGADVKAFLQFSTKANEKIFMKVGLSMANTDGALKSLEEIQGWNFDAVKNSAESSWEKELRKIVIKAKEDAVKTIFYTSLYHTYMAPTIFSDGYNNYKGTDGKVHTSSEEPVYSTHSLWDVFRAASPLLTLTQPHRVADIVNSYLTFYDQYGLLPVWDLQFNETGTMTGYHAVPIIADAILKNVKGFSISKAYTAMKKSSMQNIRSTDHYRKYGYIPHDKANESVTSTLEYAFDDWCIAQVAKKLNDKSGEVYYLKRANYYKNSFDSSTGFFRPRLSDGRWKTPFDPLSVGGEKNAYTEGNAWQHTFFVPHDVAGLQRLYNDDQGLVKKLDSLFSIDSKLTGSFVSDVTGLIGQYAHGNEPSHHIAYMYNYLGQPWKSAEMVRRICAEQYQNTPAGLSGNEDCGQMSAWYVWSALGFYPCNPANGEYVFGSPLIDEAVLEFPNNKKFTITVLNNSPANKYIRSVALNGRKHFKTYINHDSISRGGNMTITMGNSPDPVWGTSSTTYPSSMSTAK